MSFRYIFELAGKKFSEVIKRLRLFGKRTKSPQDDLKVNKKQSESTKEELENGNINDDGVEKVDESISDDCAVEPDPEPEGKVYYHWSRLRPTPRFPRKDSYYRESYYENFTSSSYDADGMEVIDQWESITVDHGEAPFEMCLTTVRVTKKQNCEKENLENVLNETKESLNSL